MIKVDQVKRIAFLLCPNCFRAVPERSGEHYCTNCGIQMMRACPNCDEPITSPEARYCRRCGSSLAQVRPKTN